MKTYIFLTNEGTTLCPNDTEINNSQVIGFANGETPENAFQELKKENEWLKGTGFDQVSCYEVGKFGGYFNLKG
jgi:hypothetical protein